MIVPSKGSIGEMQIRCDVTLVFRYRRSNSYGQHIILGALEVQPPPGRYEVAFAEDLDALVDVVRAACRTSRKVLVAWSFYSPGFFDAVTELDQFRAHVDSEKVMHLAGGVHATAEPEATLRAGFDVVAIGEGENTFASLIAALIDDQPIAAVPGLAYLDEDDTLIKTGPAVRHELDHYPSFSRRHNRCNPIEITRGCVYACKFCQTPFMFKARFRHRSIENIRDHVRFMRDRGFTDIRFITPTSLSYGSQDDSVNVDAIEQLLASVREEVGDSGRIFFGSFPSEVRPEHVSREALRILKRYVDNDNIIIGAQSGSEEVLRASNRGHDVDCVLEAVKVSLESGFQPNVDFIFGMPGESTEDALATIALAERLAEVGARIHGHTFMPLPGTPWRDAPPGEISPETLHALHRLVSQGKLYGQWRKQEQVAAELASLRRAR